MSRDIVQVVLRTSTSTSPDCSAVKRSFAESGMNGPWSASLKIAAAMARQRSTSRPVQLPCASGTPKPASPVFEPQVRKPFCLTLLRVAWADAAEAMRLAAKPTAIVANCPFHSDVLPLCCCRDRGGRLTRQPSVADRAALPAYGQGRKVCRDLPAASTRGRARPAPHDGSALLLRRRPSHATNGGRSRARAARLDGPCDRRTWPAFP